MLPKRKDELQAEQGDARQRLAVALDDEEFTAPAEDSALLDDVQRAHRSCPG